MYLPEYVDYDEDFTYIGPREDWIKEKALHAAWVGLEGMSASNSDGSSRKEAAERCVLGMPAYLFWEERNLNDLYAVAVFRLDPRHDVFTPGNQLGYLPAAVAKGCIHLHIAQAKRIGAVIRKIFSSAKGDIEVYLELTVFSCPGRRAMVGRKDNEVCAKWHSRSVKTFFSMCTALTPDKILALEKAHMLDYQKLTATDDAELLNIEGIDSEAIALIRKFYPGLNRRLRK